MNDASASKPRIVRLDPAWPVEPGPRFRGLVWNHPTLKDGTLITTSQVMEFHGGRIVTRSGSIYLLGEVLERIGMGDLEPARPVEQLGVGQQQMVEIAKALSTNAKIVIMDEPTSALTETEVAVLDGFHAHRERIEFVICRQEGGACMMARIASPPLRWADAPPPAPLAER